MGQAYSKDILVDRLPKISAILSFVFITLALVLIEQHSPATGYELSLYNSLPAATWIFLIGAVVLGTGIIVSEAFSEDRSHSWVLGFIILILCNFIVLSLHFFRGYLFMTMSDPLGHVGMTSEILSSGNIGENYYPITHIMGTVMVEIGGIDLLTVMKFLPVVFTLISMVFIYLLASAVSTNRGHALLSAAAGTTLLYSYYHISTYPQALSLLMFPVVFYLYFKASGTPSAVFNILFIILLFLFPFFHPAPELVLIFCLAGGEIGRYVWTKRVNTDSASGFSDRISSNPALISTIIFFTWFSSFTVFGTLMKEKFLKWFTGNVTEVPRFNELNVISKLEPLDQVLLAFKMYGGQFIYLFLSTIALIIVLKHYITRHHESKNLFTLSVLLLISGPVYVTIFMVLGLTTIGRLFGANTELWVIPVLSGFALYEVFTRRQIPRSIGIGFVTFILVSASMLGIFTIYRSPWIYQPNMQITQMDMDGLAWSGGHVVNGTRFGYLGWPGGYNPIVLPDHFGHPEFGTFGESLGQDMTFIMTERFWLAADDPTLSRSSVVPPGLSAQGFDGEDIERLELDSSVERWYTNGEFELLYVNAKKESMNESSADS
ncbi:MAG: hypothetical protein SCH39_04300 [Methanosarcinales archaeon]|nr:hypothetical protein [Methanosarcinales archaeon]